MSPEQFCYWLQGMLEGGNPSTLNDVQTKMVKDHLATVFRKVTPSVSPQDILERFRTNAELQRQASGIGQARSPQDGILLC